ncbi:ATP-binding cassette subfamily F protein 3 [Salsuginibacillus halophilus]|uniref:ATP-binding cassette subfamily F protein 3 n=1 Tax=Salsuginibacillus halophilus TaxID=517424 RepID=A0A2P8HL39_9BACI|nr:ABC-F family ATP-binding cassette domain-containing protein [Salsuginibacillus halophilus]PSL46933.1 ATP-binding cassette subfamily F protein 3 [Salsuginibacillus halophilus]
MIALQCVNITKSFGVETILQDAKLEIKENERVALVGRNGAGKSTLLKIIAGELQQDSGQITMPKEKKLGYLAQETDLTSKRTIFDEMLAVVEHLRTMEQEIRDLEMKMADPAVYDDKTAYEKVMQLYDEKQHDFEKQGGYQYEANIRSILNGLNFANFSEDTLVSTLSGGQKTRLALAKLLLARPDLLILDEPTNHLDIETLTWLEQYLSGYDGALLIVSHDRYFLDKIVNKTYEVTRSQIHEYKGNYSFYLEEKARRYEQEMKAFEKQQGEIAKLEDFIQKNIVRDSTSKRAQSRRKQLEKMDKIDRPDGDEKSAKFSFHIERESGREVLKAENLTFGYEQTPLFDNVEVHMKRQERVALLGPNGAGKTTLLKLLMQRLTPEQGSVTYGSKVTPGYYEQQQSELNEKNTVLEELWQDHPTTLEKDIRTVLGNFLFSGEDVLKQVADLSGGERARLSLAKLMMQKANLLIFDEPTNHLDLDSKEVLEAALSEFPGTMLFVSHDRYFLNRMATRILELTPEEGLKEYIGDYDYYRMKKEEEAEIAALQAEEQAASGGVSEDHPSANKQAFLDDKEAKREERKRLRQIEQSEADIEKLEQEIETLEASLYDPAVYEDYEEAQKIQDDIDQKRAKLEETMETWEALQT